MVEVARVVNATQVELVVISYEEIINDIEEAKKAINKKDEMETKKYLSNAKAFLKELNNALDMQFEISGVLRSLYRYINRVLIKAEIRNDIAGLDECKEIITKLMNAFSEISKKEIKYDNKSMDNVDTIYSGLTYNKYGLNETILGNTKKGLRA